MYPPPPRCAPVVYFPRKTVWVYICYFTQFFLSASIYVQLLHSTRYQDMPVSILARIPTTKRTLKNVSLKSTSTQQLPLTNSFPNCCDGPCLPCRCRVRKCSIGSCQGHEVFLEQIVNLDGHNFSRAKYAKIMTRISCK